jgi:cytidine deaminase
MSELMPKESPIYLASKTMVIKTTSIETLIPFAFDGSELPTL